MSTPKQALEGLITETTASREKLDLEIAEAGERMRALHQERHELVAEERVLRAAYARRFPGSASDLESGPLDEAPPLTLVNTAHGHLELGGGPSLPDWAEMPRTTAVERAIREMTEGTSRTVGPREIATYLHERNRADVTDEIGSATAHLNRTDRIHSLGRGKWAFGPSPEMAEDTAGAVSSGLVQPGLEEGDQSDNIPAPTAQDHD